MVPLQGLFEIRHVDRDRSRTVLLLADLYGSLVLDATVVVQGLDVMLCLRTQRLEKSVHIVTIRGCLAVLLLPDVLHNQLDYDCVEDGTRERCSNPLSVGRGVDRSRVPNGRSRHRHRTAGPQTLHSKNQHAGGV